MAAFDLIENLPFTTKKFVGAKARIGLVVLSSDYTVEHEFRQVFTQPGIDLFHARIANSPEITPQTLAAMGPTISETAGRILPGDTLDVLAYGCTSASMVLGPARIGELLNDAKPEARVTNPVTAAFAAFDALGARRIAVLTPYTSEVNDIVRAGLESGGYEVVVFGSFNEPMDPVVANIDSNSLKSAIRTIITDRDVDAVFVSCTSIRIMHAVEELEAETGLPITSSNHAMAWHCLRLAGHRAPLEGKGRLFRL
ncbi:MAG: maleate cis-trans isomerase family protein [Rhizobiaceae bacterium]